MEKELKLLWNQGKFADIVTLTNGAIDLTSLLFRLRSLAELGFNDEALRLLQVHFDVLKAKPGIIFPIHAALIKAADDRPNGFKILKTYQQLPYDSMETEDAMKEFETWLTRPTTRKAFSFDTWKQLIANRNSSNDQRACEVIPDSDIVAHIDDFSLLLIAPTTPMVRYQTLLRLMKIDYQHSVTCESDGLMYEVIPAMIELPDESDEYQAIFKLLQGREMKLGIPGMATGLLYQYAVSLFPGTPPYEDQDNLMAALSGLACRYMHLPQEGPKTHVQALMEEIEEALLRFTASGNA